VGDGAVIMKLSRHDAVSELDAAIDLRHTCGYVTMLRASARRRASGGAPVAADSSAASPTTTSTATTDTHVFTPVVSSSLSSVVFYCSEKYSASLRVCRFCLIPFTNNFNFCFSYRTQRPGTETVWLADGVGFIDDTACALLRLERCSV